MKSGLSHQREESDRFHRDRLTACVRTGDNDYAVLPAEGDGYRDDLLSVEQRVSRADEADAPVAGYPRLRAVHSERQLALREDERELGYIAVIEREGGLDISARRGQLREYALDLGLFLDFEHTELVVRLDDRHRLDEERRAGRGGVMDKSFHLVSVLDLDRDDIASVSHCDNVFLKILVWSRR